MRGDHGWGFRPELHGATGKAEPTGGVGMSAGKTGEAGLERARAVGTGIVSPTSGPGCYAVHQCFQIERLIAINRPYRSSVLD